MPDDTSREPLQGNQAVADDTDFLDLYARLRLEPGCTLAEFKQAYRRHVAQWHPDRRPAGRADAIAAKRLQRLTAQYGAAMDFHRRHGRLPGAPLSAAVAADLNEGADNEPADRAQTRMQAAGSHDAMGQGYGPHSNAPSGHTSHAYGRPAQAGTDVGVAPVKVLSTRWRLLAGVIAVAVLAWTFLPAASEPGSDEAKAAAAEASSTASAPASVTMLALGMSEEQVAKIEGEPNHRDSDEWEYGPSWVRFDHGAVSDWYSSPLRGLHVPGTRPGR